MKLRRNDNIVNKLVFNGKPLFEKFNLTSYRIVKVIKELLSI